MKVELKKVKHFPSMSEETECFQASIYIDGKEVGFAEDRGCGGCIDYRFNDKAVGERFEAYAKSLPSTTFDMEGHDPIVVESSGETVIGDLLNEYLKAKEEKKEAARLAKKDQKAKAQFLARGIPMTVRVTGQKFISWYGMRDKSELPAIIEKFSKANSDTVVNTIFV